LHCFVASRAVLHLFYSFCSYSFDDLLHLIGFPTRRSSDLVLAQPGEHGVRTDLLLRREQPGERLSEQVHLATSAPRAPRVEASGGRKGTRLNSSHVSISYDVFCLNKYDPIAYLLYSYLRDR